MTKVKCEVCGKEIDARGISGHMRTHQSKTDVVSKVQPSGTHREKQVKEQVEEQVEEDVLTYPEQKPVKKPVKKVTKKKPKFINDKHANKKKNENVQETVPKKEWSGFFV